MKKSLPKFFLILGVPMFAVVGLLLSLERSAAQSFSIPEQQRQNTEGITITLDAPVISPTFGGMCDSGWYSFTNELEQDAYLALNYNLEDAEARINSGIWRPDLPQAGSYRVEAFIPEHASIGWDCPKITVEDDTQEANYVVHHAYGEKTVSADQSGPAGVWRPLGEFVFDAGSDGYVELTNLNSEDSMTRTVSFSAMRFTWLRPPPKIVYMPTVPKDSGRTVALEDLWSSDPAGGTKYAFLPGEPISYHASGTNQSGQPVNAKVLWTQDGDACGSTTIFSGTVTLDKGDWSQSHQAVLPNCIGVYTQTIQITYVVTTFTQKSQFVVNYPSYVAKSDRPAFDRCYKPTVSQMQTWKEESPYQDFNLYIGGISYGCSDYPLDPVWIHQVSKQGWSFILTWVGPQAPCSKFKYKMSSNDQIAYLQGRYEADAATAAARDLGLMGDRAIYYDLESYSGADTACRETVKSFIQGWVERIHELGNQAGFYGAPCTSYISDWAEVDPMPDNVWIAYWTTDEWMYDPDVTVWNVPCDVGDNLWSEQQRIRQYTGGHRETYGGVSLTIDSNIADGDLTTLPHVLGNVTDAPNAVSLSVLQPQIQDFQLLPDGQGWALVDGRLLWTADGGSQWEERTPSAFASSTVLAGYFQDARQGWFVLRDLEGQINILHSLDGGKSWEAAALPDPNGDLSIQAAEAYLNFIDSKTGWVAFKLQSGSSFSLGELYGTIDGGKTWERLTLPVGEPVHFIDAMRGWTAGGVSGSELYRTTDGGHSWQSQSVFPPGMVVPGQTFISPPVFQNEREGQLVMAYGQAPHARAAIFTTQDGGDSWRLGNRVDLGPDAEPGAALPVSSNGDGGMYFALPGKARLFGVSGEANALRKVESASLPEGVIKLSFVNAQSGWAQVENGRCSGVRVQAGSPVPENKQPFQCELSSYLMSTQDGGLTWREISPRSPSTGK